MKTKKQLMTESYGYATLSSELHMNHWNDKLSQVEGLGFDAPKQDKSQPMAQSESRGLNIKSINESVAELMGMGSVMDEFSSPEVEAEVPAIEEDELELEPSDEDLWADCTSALPESK